MAPAMLGIEPVLVHESGGLAGGAVGDGDLIQVPGSAHASAIQCHHAALDVPDVRTLVQAWDCDTTGGGKQGHRGMEDCP